MLVGFDSVERLDRFVGALQEVIQRHDILRTAVVWEGLTEPVQVVWREAPLRIDDVGPVPVRGSGSDLRSGSDSQRLQAHFGRHAGIERVDRAPLLRGYKAYDEAEGRWVLQLLSHHLVVDHTTLEVLLEEARAHLLGKQGGLAAPVGFREFVAQSRWGVSEGEHEEYFRKLLGEVSEPTAPLELLDVRGDGRAVHESRVELPRQLSGRLRQVARVHGVSVASVCHANSRCECGERVPCGVGTGTGRTQWAQRCGVWDAAIWTDACGRGS
jgi:hypothetical protein